MSDGTEVCSQIPKGAGRTINPEVSGPIADAFFVEEYRSLREEILKRADQQMKTEVYVFGACAAIYGFTITIAHQNSLQVMPLIWMIWWLPVFLLLAGLIRWWSTHIIILRIADYIKEYHEAYARGEGKSRIGWEHRQYQQRAGKESYPLWNYTFKIKEVTWSTTAVFWILAIVIAVTVAVWQNINPSTSDASATDLMGYPVSDSLLPLRQPRA